MSVSVVNGYFCYNSCDAEKARAGKDPHPKQNIAQGDKSVGSKDSSAVIFDGALAALNAVPRAAAISGGASPYPQAAGVDILA